MYGLIGQFRAHPGQRDALLQLLLADVGAMPGCLSYVVARDTGDADGIWVTEVWSDAASHAASLGLPAVKATIERAMPLIAGFGQHTTTQVVGGLGLPSDASAP